MNAILAAHDERVPRYLSKNNDNILRLGSIRRAFLQALILVPFHDPSAHAGSLQRTHGAFADQQAEDKFVKPYITWLVHHEFGHDHRPFRFDGDEPAVTAWSESIDYWLALWCETYGWFENAVPEDVISTLMRAFAPTRPSGRGSPRRRAFRPTARVTIRSV